MTHPSFPFFSLHTPYQVFRDPRSTNHLMPCAAGQRPVTGKGLPCSPGPHCNSSTMQSLSQATHLHLKSPYDGSCSKDVCVWQRASYHMVTTVVGSMESCGFASEQGILSSAKPSVPEPEQLLYCYLLHNFKTGQRQSRGDATGTLLSCSERQLHTRGCK